MKTWWNTLKLSKLHEEIPTDTDTDTDTEKAIPWIASSKSSDQKLVKLECHIECSIASFGSGKTTDSDHLHDKKLRVSLKIAKIAHY